MSEPERTTKAEATARSDAEATAESAADALSQAGAASQAETAGVDTAAADAVATVEVAPMDAAREPAPPMPPDIAPSAPSPAAAPMAAARDKELEPTPTPTAAGIGADVEPTPQMTPATADAILHEALEPPRAIEDAAAYVPRPGSPAAEPAVQAARAEAEAARTALAVEIDRLRDAGRRAVDVKAKVKGMPAAIAREPAKFLGLGAAGAGAGILVSRLRRGRKKAMPPGLLPPEVESALEGIGPDAAKVREALNAGFTRYLETEGAQAATPRRKVPGLIPLFILPVASTIAREAIKRLVAGPPKR
jgi:hypothetical protein